MKKLASNAGESKSPLANKKRQSINTTLVIQVLRLTILNSKTNPLTSSACVKNNIKNKKQLIGEVISSPMEKTAVVKVERRFPHSVYKKFISKSKKYYTAKMTKMGRPIFFF